MLLPWYVLVKFLFWPYGHFLGTNRLFGFLLVVLWLWCRYFKCVLLSVWCLWNGRCYGIVSISDLFIKSLYMQHLIKTLCHWVGYVLWVWLFLTYYVLFWTTFSSNSKINGFYPKVKTVTLQWLEHRWLTYHGWFKLVFESLGNSSDSSRKHIFRCISWEYSYVIKETYVVCIY